MNKTDQINNMSKVPSFIIRQLKDKITQRYVVNSEDFFFIIEGMGLMDNEECLFEILEYLEEAKIDVHFKTGTEQLRYNQFKKIEERGNVGCGYIPDAHMDSILGCTAKMEAGNCNPSADFLIKTGYFQRNAFSEASNHKNSASAVYAESWAIYCQ